MAKNINKQTIDNYKAYKIQIRKKIVMLSKQTEKFWRINRKTKI